jgi:hypothetical protein
MKQHFYRKPMPKAWRTELTKQFLELFILDHTVVITTNHNGMCENCAQYHVRNGSTWYEGWDSIALLIDSLAKDDTTLAYPIEGSRDGYYDNEYKYTGEWLTKRKELAQKVIDKCL